MIVIAQRQLFGFRIVSHAAQVCCNVERARSAQNLLWGLPISLLDQPLEPSSFDRMLGGKIANVHVRIGKSGFIKCCDDRIRLRPASTFGKLRKQQFGDAQPAFRRAGWIEPLKHLIAGAPFMVTINVIVIDDAIERIGDRWPLQRCHRSWLQSHADGCKTALNGNRHAARLWPEE